MAYAYGNCSVRRRYVSQLANGPAGFGGVASFAQRRNTISRMAIIAVSVTAALAAAAFAPTAALAEHGDWDHHHHHSEGHDDHHDDGGDHM